LFALRRQSLGDGMLDTMLMWRAEQLRAPEHQSIKHMQAWKLKTNVSVDMLEQEASALEASRYSIGHIALGVALSYIDFASRVGMAQRPSAPQRLARHVRHAARARANEAVDD